MGTSSSNKGYKTENDTQNIENMTNIRHFNRGYRYLEVTFKCPMTNRMYVHVSLNTMIQQ